MTDKPWGTWHDPETERQLNDYERHGFRLITPAEHRLNSPEELGRTALACNGLLAKMYGPEYPLNTNIGEAITTGATDLYTLESPDGKLAAMAALVHTQNPLGGSVRFTEIGRAVKNHEVMSLKDTSAGRLSAQGILRIRAMRAMGSQTDILFSTTRTAANRPGMPGGYGVQHTWWGSQAKNPTVQIPMVTTASGYDYRIGRVQPQPEPFNGFMIPTDPERWANAVNQSEIYVPPGTSKSIIETLFNEATRGEVGPTINVANRRINAATAPFAMLQPASRLAGGKYVLADRPPGDLQISLNTIDQEFAAGAFSQKIIIETDVASTEKCAGVLASLYARGWVLAGWHPSYRTYGGVCPVVTRAHPTEVLVNPELSPANFATLKGTREVLDHVYNTIESEHA